MQVHGDTMGGCEPPQFDRDFFWGLRLREADLKDGYDRAPHLGGGGSVGRFHGATAGTSSVSLADSLPAV